MQVTFEFLGSGDAFGSGGRFQSCHLLTGGRVSALVDCGASSPVVLQQRGIDPTSVTHVLLSHLHGDHFAGLPFLLLDATYNRPRRDPIVIAGPPDVGGRVLETLDLLYPGSRARVVARVPHRFVDWRDRERVDLGGLAVTPFPVPHGHGVSAYALRIEIQSRTIAYSGDTQWTPVLADVADAADLFVCECVGWRAGVPSHLSHERLVEHAGALTARQIVLTHLGPDMLAHASESRWPCASDGLVITL